MSTSLTSLSAGEPYNPFTQNTSTGIIDTSYTSSNLGIGTSSLGNVLISNSTAGGGWGSYATYSDSFKEYKPLKNISYNATFEIDKDNLLRRNIKGIRKNKIIFNCDCDVDKRIQPYEFIMKLIESKKTFFIRIEVSDILTVMYTNVRFTEVSNNLNFDDGNCDFSTLKVKFKYDKIEYENEKLSIKQKRTDKMQKIIENNE